MKTIKYSRQRESIMNYLMSRTDHPTADMIYSAIREVYPKISLGTVYRNLTLLADQGEIIELSCGEGCDRFDARTMPHYHFICRKCGSVTDLAMPSLEHINLLAEKDFAGQIEGHYAYFYGVCEHCIETN